MLVETLVWPGFVIVVEELLEDGGEVLPAEDQEVVEQLPTNGTDPAAPRRRWLAGSETGVG